MLRMPTKCFRKRRTARSRFCSSHKLQHFSIRCYSLSILALQKSEYRFLQLSFVRCSCLSGYDDLEITCIRIGSSLQDTALRRYPTQYQRSDIVTLQLLMK